MNKPPEGESNFEAGRIEPEHATERPLVVIKVGTNAIMDPDTGELRTEVLRVVAEEVISLRDEYDKNVIVVTSGAVARGMKLAGIETFPEDPDEMRYLSGLGWASLVAEWKEALGEWPVGALLTHDRLEDLEKRLQLGQAIEKAFEAGHVILANENDLESPEELVDSESGQKKLNLDTMPDNDELACRLVRAFSAESWVILSDVPGVYDKDPKQHADATLLEHDPGAQQIEVSPRSGTSRGGMNKKLAEIRKARRVGADVYVGKPEAGNILGIIDDSFRGTRFRGYIQTTAPWALAYRDPDTL